MTLGDLKRYGVKFFPFIVAAIPLLGTVVSAGQSIGQGKSLPSFGEWHIQEFTSQIRVLQDGRVQIQEEITARFDGRFNGLYRDIPVEYTDDTGLEYNLHLEDITVKDRAGNSLEHKVFRKGRYQRIKVWIPGARNTTKTVRLEYETRRGLRFFDEYDELYWNATGTEWPVRIDTARASVWLPENISGVQARAFTGSYGSQSQGANVTVEGRRIEAMTTDLEAKEGLTINVAWDPGVVEQPGVLTRAGMWMSDNWLLGLPFLVFGVMFWLWYTRGRDPDIGSIAPRYAPPQDMRPAELGVLIDNTPDMRDITATIVDLAVRGYIEIIEYEKTGLLGTQKEPGYGFKLLKGPEKWEEEDPRDYEKSLMLGMFGDLRGGQAMVAAHRGGIEGVTVRTDDLEGKFYKQLQGLKETLLEQVHLGGLYGRRPDRVRGTYLAVALLCAVGVVGMATMGESWLPGSPVSLLIGGGLSAALVGGFGWVMPARTRRGARLLRETLGFEEFLSRVEEDRFRKMIDGPEDFEKYLPYAMAFGVSKKWARAFEDLYQEPPEWYTAEGETMATFHTTHFTTEMTRMSSLTGSAMQTSPRGAGSSVLGGGGFGGGGGGFSGGGFGGGGGGAF